MIFIESTAILSMPFWILQLLYKIHDGLDTLDIFASSDQYLLRPYIWLSNLVKDINK